MSKFTFVMIKIKWTVSFIMIKNKGNNIIIDKINLKTLLKFTLLKKNYLIYAISYY
jgi:hypothetical protein